jgi:hypothetical protein
MALLALFVTRSENGLQAVLLVTGQWLASPCFVPQADLKAVT